MMRELVNEMKRDGLDELFAQVHLPFPTMAAPCKVELSGRREVASGRGIGEW